MRVSTDLQTIEQQRQAIEEYAKTHKMTIDKFIADEGVSAYRKSFNARSGLLEVLELAEQNLITDLLLFETSRISRRYGESVGLFDRLTSKGIKIHSVVDGGVINAHEIDQLMIAFRSWANQQASKLTSERIKAKQAHLKQQGFFIGGSVAWGFKVVDKRVVIDESLKDVVIDFFNDYITHGTGYIMNKYKLNRVTINKRIKNEDYKKIIGAELWNHANKMRTSRACRKDYTAKTNRSDRSLFEGLLYHICGKKIYISNQAQGMYYRCYDCASQGRKTYKGPELEQLIESEVIHVFDDLSYDKLKEQYLVRIEKVKLVLELEKKSLDAEIESIKNTITSLKKKLAHFICVDGSDNIIKNISDLINEHEQDLTTLMNQQDDINNKFITIESRIESQLKNIENILNAKDIYFNASFESKKTILQLIIKKIVIDSYDNIDIFLNI